VSQLEAARTGVAARAPHRAMLDLKSSGTTAAELPRTTAFTNLSMLFAGMFDVFNVSRFSCPPPIRTPLCRFPGLALPGRANPSTRHRRLISSGSMLTNDPRCRSRAPNVYPSRAAR